MSEDERLDEAFRAIFSGLVLSFLIGTLLMLAGMGRALGPLFHLLQPIIGSWSFILVGALLGALPGGLLARWWFKRRVARSTRRFEAQLPGTQSGSPQPPPLPRRKAS